MFLHLGAIMCDQKITSRLEQLLAVTPWRTDERNSTGQSFERANRRNPSQRIDIRPARNVNSDFVAREHFRNAIIRDPATILDAGPLQQFPRILRVADAEDFGPELELTDRLNQKLG